VSVVGELSTHGAAEGGVVREKAAGVMHPPSKFMFLCELNVGGGGVLFVEQEVRSVKVARVRRAPCPVVLERGV
jgi:hypothetical protein